MDLRTGGLVYTCLINHILAHSLARSHTNTQRAAQTLKQPHSHVSHTLGDYATYTRAHKRTITTTTTTTTTTTRRRRRSAVTTTTTTTYHDCVSVCFLILVDQFLVCVSCCLLLCLLVCSLLCLLLCLLLCSLVFLIYAA